MFLDTTETIEVSPLAKLVEELNYQNKVKEDLVVMSDDIRYSALNDLLYIGSEQYRITDHTHDQISEKLVIPRSYYRRMKSENPDLLQTNINSWMSLKEKTKYLLRTFKYKEEGIQNVCRAMLSNKYAVLDNFDVLLGALEAIKKTGIHVEILKAEITEKRMYLHIVAPEIHIQATELLDGYLANTSTAVLNNGIISGIVISNSEVGLGTMEISARAQILKCTNGLHDRDAKYRKVHLGGRLDQGIVNWSEQTKQKNYQLIISQVGDAVNTYLSKEYLGQLTTKLQKYKETPVEHPIGVITRVNTELSISDSHKNQILRHFLKDGDESVFGMLNAYTRFSQTLRADEQYAVESDVFSLLPKIHGFDKPLSSN